MVKVVKPSQQWEITDNQDRWIIKKEKQALKVYKEINKNKHFSFEVTFQSKGKTPHCVWIDGSLKNKMPASSQENPYVSPNDYNFKMIYNGSEQWMEKSLLADKTFRSASKIRLDKIPDRKGFVDISQSFFGIGLYTGMDYPLAMETFFHLYTFKFLGEKTINKEGCFMLEGKLNEKLYRVFFRQQSLSPYGLDFAINAAQTVSLYISEKDYSLRGFDGYFMGFGLTSYRIKEIQFNLPISENLFKYTPPKGFEVQDLTDEIIKSKKKEK